MYIHHYKARIGILEIKANEKAITEVKILRNAPVELQTSSNNLIREACIQFDEYFSGKRRKFDLPLSTEGTPFQQAVWKQLQEIPFGETISYLQLAKAVKSPKACRAVGSANGKNPIPIIIPCHRVISADGGLGGFSCGVDIKVRLIELEKACR